jgi:hypothetical protein
MVATTERGSAMKDVKRLTWLDLLRAGLLSGGG